VVVPNGVDVAELPLIDRQVLRRELGWEDRFVAIYAGAHGLANRLGTLVEAARLLRRRDDSLLVAVGDGPERRRLMESAKDVGNLVWMDAVSPERAFQLVAAANVGLVLLQDNPTFRTVFPNKMFVAMAAEVPVVVAVDGAARELVVENNAGVFVSPETPEDLAAAIGFLARDPVQCLQMGWNGRQLVESRFDRRAHASRYLEVLQEVIR